MSQFSYFDFFKHAVSTPLSNILLNSQLALSEERNKNHNLKKILLSANYIKNLLDGNKHEEKKLFLINDALVEIILLNQCFHQEVSYVKQLKQTKDFKLNGNKLLFQETINCLLNNAIEAYQLKKLNKIVLIKSQVKNNFLEIAIADGGQGMTWLQQKLVGRKFYSLKDNHQGVGLFYAKKIIKQNFNGSLKLISKKNQGSTALIQIPFYQNLK